MRVDYGAGFKTVLAQNLSIKVEYLRADFGEKTIFVSLLPCPSGSVFN
jgi:hypothetical protein